MKYLYLSLLALVLSALVFICGCNALLKEPEISVSSIDLVSVTPEDLMLNVTLAVDNQNPIGITCKKILCNVSYQNAAGWEPVSQVEKHDLSIKKGMNYVTLPVYAKNSDLIKAGFSLLKNGEITIKAEGIVEPSFMGFSPDIPFSQIRTIPLRK